jgi:transcription termination/antitermination protein NusA
VAAELMSALEELNASVGIPLEDLVRTVEGALAAAYKKAFDPPGEITVRLDRETAEIEVTSRVRRPDGSVEETRLPSEDFRRLAAQTARQAVMRQIRDLERDRALKEVAQHRGELASGVVDRMERGTVYLDMGRAEGVLPPEEQIPGEELRPGRPLTVLMVEPRASHRQAQVLVSRASRYFVQRLLEAEVPEIAAGSVAVKAIAREAGLRTKIAVTSSQPGVDPVGACVGPRGVRHRSLLAELDREHVDIVPWSEDPSRFVAAALGPASVVEVRLDPETRTANVLVPRDQLSLAIGKDGQNARLAAKLTGWRIDIKGRDQPEPASEPGAQDAT